MILPPEMIASVRRTLHKTKWFALLLGLFGGFYSSIMLSSIFQWEKRNVLPKLKGLDYERAESYSFILFDIIANHTSGNWRRDVLRTWGYGRGDSILLSRDADISHSARLLARKHYKWYVRMVNFFYIDVAELEDRLKRVFGTDTLRLLIIPHVNVTQSLGYSQLIMNRNAIKYVARTKMNDKELKYCLGESKNQKNNICSRFTVIGDNEIFNLFKTLDDNVNVVAYHRQNIATRMERTFEELMQRKKRKYTTNLLSNLHSNMQKFLNSRDILKLSDSTLLEKVSHALEKDLKLLHMNASVESLGSFNLNYHFGKIFRTLSFVNNTSKRFGYYMLFAYPLTRYKIKMFVPSIKRENFLYALVTRDSVNKITQFLNLLGTELLVDDVSKVILIVVAQEDEPKLLETAQATLNIFNRKQRSFLIKPYFFTGFKCEAIKAFLSGIIEAERDSLALLLPVTVGITRAFFKTCQLMTIPSYQVYQPIVATDHFLRISESTIVRTLGRNNSDIQDGNCDILTKITCLHSGDAHAFFKIYSLLSIFKTFDQNLFYLD